jgi:Tfp pilus assembly protein PilN
MTRLNLVPESIQIATARRRRLSAWAVAGLCGAAAVAGPLAIDWFQRTEIRRLQARSSRLRGEAERTRGELRSATEEVSRLRLQLQRADAVRNKRPWSGILGLLNGTLPVGCWLTSVGTDPAAGPSTVQAAAAPTPSAGGRMPEEKKGIAVMDAPRKLKLSGYAADASLPHAFVKNLKGSSLFAHVNLQKTAREAVGDGQYYRFDVECEW